jgi:hypothetical protein
MTKQRREFLKPTFLVSTAISILVFLVAIRSSCRSDEAIELSRRTFTQQYEEQFSLEGQLKLARNASFFYWSAGTETLATTLPIVTDYWLTNNSRFPATITQIEYWLYDSTVDTMPRWLPGSVVSRGAATDTIPHTVEPGGTLCINDTIDVFFDYLLHPLLGIPGTFRPASFKKNPPSWLDCPIDWTLKMMLMQELCVPYSRSNTGYNIHNLDSVCRNNNSFLRTAIRSARGTKIEFDYWYFSDSSAVRQR